MKYRQQFVVGLLALSLASVFARAQGPGATILKEPADWRFERLPVPAPFAPEIKLTGFEEARFAPGMFDTSSANYFTYAMVIVADGNPKLGRLGLEEFLQKYYRGLSIGVGRRKGLTPDPAQMSVEVVPMQSGEDASNRYTAKVVFFDTFNDGRKLMLNVEAHVISRPGAKKTYMSLLVTPQGPDSAVWQTLRGIERKLHFPE
jgi:hypothetical protein